MENADKLDQFGQAFVASHNESDPLPDTIDAGEETGPDVRGGGEPVLRSQVIDALKEVYDPEIPVNIYDLGLIYRIEIDEANHVEVEMTLTSPNCPVAESLPGWVENAAKGVTGITGVEVDLVFDPPWDQERMTEAARLELGMF